MAADDKGEIEAFESTAFEALEKDFQEVLQELIGDKSLEHFRLEYEKLHRALKKSHESEKRLIKKCRELNGEIVSNAVKVQTALNLSKEDQSTIQNLKKEIERAWKMVEASHDKEQRAKETIHNLKVEIANLSHLVEQGAGLSVNQENTVNSLVSQRDELVKTRERLEAQVQKMTQDNINLTELEHRHESEKLQGEVEIANVKDMLNAKRTEAEREMRRRERLEKELSELRSALAVKNKQLEGYVKEIKNQEDQHRADNLALREKKELVVKAKDREADVVAQIETERSALRQKEMEKTEMHNANIDLQKQIKERQEEIKLGMQDNDKSQKNYEGLKRRKLLDDDERRELEVNRAVLKSDVENLIREIEQLRKQVDGDAKKVEEIMRERETLTRSVMRAEDKTKTQSDVVKEHQNRAQGLEKDVLKVKLDLQAAIKTVYDKDKEREKFGIEVSMANTKFMASLEELKNRDNKTSELKKNLSDVRSKLAQQKNQYEAVRTDRNLYSKNLVESQDEIAEMKRKFKIMHHQIEQLKEEIKEKDQALQQEQNHHRKVEKTNDQLKDQMERAKKRQDQLQKQKETSQAEIKKLVDSIKDAEEQRNQQKKTYEEKISERDILGTQLIRRNDELALLYEKIKIQQRTLQEGEVAYKQRLEESRALQIMAAGLKREKAIAYQQVNSIDDLKKEIFSLQRELLRERTKVKALSEELENPMNVHRWRKLEGQDPATFEMIQKVKTLQKRLISKTEEAVEKDLAIQEKEKLYLEMRNLLAKQPGPEIVEEASHQQQSLKERTRQMKAMAAELNMYHAQLNDYKDEIERLTKELQDTKRKYFEQRRREQLVRDASRGTERASAGGAQTGSGGLNLQLG